MFDFQILCEPDKKTPVALAAPQQQPQGLLVIAEPNKTDAHQVWQLEPFAGVDEHDHAVLAFYLVNKQTGLVAQAPQNVDGAVKPDTQSVTQAAKDAYNIISPIRLWTLDPVGAGFAIRPLGDVHQNLNAWDKKVEAGTNVGIYRWKDGQANEVWGIKAIG